MESEITSQNKHCVSLPFTSPRACHRRLIEHCVSLPFTSPQACHRLLVESTRGPLKILAECCSVPALYRPSQSENDLENQVNGSSHMHSIMERSEKTTDHGSISTVCSTRNTLTIRVICSLAESY